MFEQHDPLSISSDLGLTVQIIVVSYHSNIDLRRCLPRLAETVADCPVTIVDNAFPDESIDWIPHQYPQWRMINSPENRGFGHANNLAAAGSTADILIFLNPDTVPVSGWLAALLLPFTEDQAVGLTTAKIILLSEPNALNTAGNAVHLSGLTTCRGIRAPLDKFSVEEAVGAVSGACFAIRRSLYEALHGFDESFFLYMEDTDLSLRAALIGQKILYTPLSIIYHDYELKFNNQKIYYQERNRYMMLLKIFRWRTLLMLIPMFIMGEGITWGFILLRERRSIWNKMRAYGWVIRHWQLLRQRRREVQSRRVKSDHDLLTMLVERLDVTQFGNSMLIQFLDTTIARISKPYHRFLLKVVHW